MHAMERGAGLLPLRRAAAGPVGTDATAALRQVSPVHILACFPVLTIWGSLGKMCS